MLPNPRIFRSRWTALLWAGGILWFAYDIAGSAPHADTAATAGATDAATTDASGATVNDADLQAIANIIGS